MPIVFVHGVSNRWGADYARAIKNLEVLFHTVSLPLAVANSKAVTITTTYWGDLGGNPSAGGTFGTLPTSGGFETFGGSTVVPEVMTRDLVQVVATQPDQPLLAIARQVSLPSAIDLMWACAVESVEEPDVLRQMAGFIAQALEYAERVPTPRWLTEVNEDLALIVRLKQEVEAGQTEVGEQFGGPGEWWGYLVSGARSARDFAQRSLIGVPRRLGSQLALYFLRPWMTTLGARTMGDALVYVARRGSAEEPGEIVRLVQGQVNSAAAKRTEKDPLVLIGHSLGGVILYDLLSYFARDLRCDLLVTVGSQVGFFQELGLLADKQPQGGSPAKRISRPTNIKRWLNVFDSVDVLAFTAQPVFTGVEDFTFSSETGALSAHTAYLWSPRFHRRLGVRMGEALR